MFNIVEDFFCVSLIIAWVVLVSVVIIHKIQKKPIDRWFVVVAVIPIALAVLYFIYNDAPDIILSKPNKTDLVGSYHITEVTAGSFKPASLKNFKLVFKTDGTFTLTHIPQIATCETGTYEVDYAFVSNELSFKCDNSWTTAHIVREFGGYRIEFVRGDPDSGESIFFEKDKD